MTSTQSISVNFSKVLIVDDDPGSLAGLSAILSARTFSVLIANSGEKGLEVASSKLPDLILLDIRMPGLSGLQVCQRLKANPVTANIPVLFLTASTDQIEEAFSVGGVDYILKPFKTAELIARVNTHLQIARLVESLEKTNLELEQLNFSLEEKVKERTRDLIAANTQLRNEVNERRYLQDKINYLSRYDFVTRMFNRASMEDHLTRLLVDKEADANWQRQFFLFMDLDQFKVINDTCSHIAGDELLRNIGELITGVLTNEETAARMGGDEFAIAFPAKDLKDALVRAKRIQQVIEDFSFNWDENTFRLGVSMGLLEIDNNFDNINHLISIAERTCGESKTKGGGEISVYNITKAHIDRSREQMRWIPIIQQALNEDKFFLCGQYIVDLNTDENEKIEVLIRLESDDTVMPPGHFIPVAEKYHMISAIDKWVFKKTLQQRHLIKKPLQLSINLSGETITKSGFDDYVIALFKSMEADPEQICFEVTETSALSDLKATRQFIDRLKPLGCKFALDDFGTGVSSYGYLKGLPVDYLKIDGIFVRDIEHEKINQMMVESITSIAKEMNIQVIAECVETAETYKLLKKIGVDYAQGFHLHKPTRITKL